MAWFWKSKSSKKKTNEAAPEPIMSAEPVEEEIQPFLDDQLVLDNQLSEPDLIEPIHEHAGLEEDVLGMIAEAAPPKLTYEELQAVADSTRIELDSLRTHSEETISQLTAKSVGLEASLVESQHRLQLLDEANVTMAKMLGERDQKIDELQKSHEAVTQQNSQQVAELESRLAATTTQTTSIVADLKQQLDSLKSQNDASQQQIESLKQQLDHANQTAATQISELEQRHLTIHSGSTDRIASLEKQLAESEARSTNRAEQRSALLRNMIEIHRLSATSAKAEPPSESLKLVNAGWTDNAPQPPQPPAAESSSSSPFYSRGTNWSESKESESA